MFGKLKATAAAKVKLDVGGQLFTTSTTTMKQADEGSPLEILFSGRHGPASDDDEPVFLDRDPALFKYVINYLRALASGLSSITATSPGDVARSARGVAG